MAQTPLNSPTDPLCVGPGRLSPTDDGRMRFTRDDKSISSELVCRVQLPIALGEAGEPEPDIVVARRKADDFRHAHPEPCDVDLIVEVSESSIRFDRGRKMHDYARGGVVEYWIADVNRESMLVHYDPDPNEGEYRNVQQFDRDAKLSPQAAPDCELDLAWLFR